MCCVGVWFDTNAATTTTTTNIGLPLPLSNNLKDNLEIKEKLGVVWWHTAVMEAWYIKRQDTIIHVKALQNQTPPNELHGLYLAFQILVFSNISLFKDEDFTSWFFPFFSF